MFLGVDLGTSIIKAAMFHPDGTAAAVRSRPAHLISPQDGWFEQDPEEVLTGLAEVVRAAVAEAGEPPRLVGITGQGDGVWLADADGRPVRPAISWMDARATPVVDRWVRDGVVQDVYARTGGTLFPGAAAAILAWMEEHEPESLDSATTAGYCKDLVMQRLTGVRATDPSEASLPFLDPRSLDYDITALRSCGLEHRAGLLAPVARPVPAGELTAEGAQLLGLPAGTPVASGPFDLPACAIGSGLRRHGDGHVIVGTTLACQVLVDALDTDREPTGMHLSMPTTQDLWLRALPAMVGTAAIDWVLSIVGARHDDLDGILSDSRIGAGGVTCLPYFSPSGERAPFLEPRARAGFDELTLQTTRADLVRATCESVAYAARHCLDTAGLTGDVVVSGGGMASRRWMAVFADVLGRPIHLARPGEAGARGAVLAAARTFGADIDPTEWTTVEETVPPDATRAAHYEEGYAEHLHRVRSARERWQPLTATQEVPGPRAAP
ncbi:carbohydrate kinase [Spiractinospora alimapuensis]|uniref:FGGY-family carbohydrate kinase n=1 Tax=Spiractinospora alimapuensis TaxID=2820884 RepID=UPI001F1F7DF4|nr:FGGY-family carbohydrate kinase [Spiractinospora alimapuensis]QVQ51759.1 carbohydrate kinase [Spiractinospora alimapuensis]